MTRTTHQIALFSFVFLLFSSLAAASFYAINLHDPANFTVVSNRSQTSQLPWVVNSSIADANPNTQTATINFTFNFTGNTTVIPANASILGNFTGVWGINFSNYTTVTRNVSMGYVLVNVTQGKQYVWNVLIYNHTGNELPYTNTTTNYTFYVDFVPSNLSVVTTEGAMHQVNNTNISVNYAFLNISVSDRVTNISRCLALNVSTGANVSGTLANIYGSTGEQDKFCTVNFTNLADGLYNTTLYVNDSGNNFNSTQEQVGRLYYFNIDTVDATAINLASNSFANNSNMTRNYTFVNVTFTELNPANCILEYNNGSGNLNYTMALVNNPSGSDSCSFNVTSNFTVAAGETHNWTVFVNDSAGNVNASARFYIRYDTQKPGTLALVAPTHNNTFFKTNYTFVNFTFVDNTPQNCILEYDNGSGNVNYTMAFVNNPSGSDSCSFNVTANFTVAASDPDNFTVYFNDSSGNLNDSGRFFVTFDSIYPGTISRSTNMFPNNTNTTYNYTFVNFTFVDSNPANCILEYNNGTNANYTMALVNNPTGLDSCSFNVTANFTVATGQTQNYTVFFNDSTGNVNNSGIFYIRHDSVTPDNINVVTLYNQSFVSTNYTFINFTFFDETGLTNCLLEYNNGSGAVNFTMTSNYFFSTQTGFCALNVTSNFTSASGDFDNFSIFVNDSAGKMLRNGTFFVTHDSLFADSITRGPTTFANNSNVTTNYTFVNFTFVDVNAQNCILQYNNGSGNTNYTMALVSAATDQCSLNVTGNFTVAAGETHNYTVFFNDSAGNVNNSGLQYIRYDTVRPTSISALAWWSTNNSFVTTNYTFINVSFADGTPQNCILEYGNSTGTANYTMALANNAAGADHCTFNVTANFTVAASQTHNFTVYVNDSAGNLNNTVRLYVTHDSTFASTLTLISPTVNNSNVTVNYSFINGTFVDSNPANCILQYNNGSGNVNYTMALADNSAGADSCSFNVTANFTVAASQTHNFTIFINDTSGNVNNSGLISITHDSVTPTALALASPMLANNSNTSNNYVFYNFTLNEANPHVCLLQTNGSNVTMNMTGTGSNTYCQYNATGQSEGMHNATLYVNDSTGHLNSTSMFFIRVDTTYPNVIAFVSPGTNNSNQSTNYTFINVSFNATSPANCTLSYNNGTGNVNFSMALASSGASCSLNVTGNFTATGQRNNFTVTISTGGGRTNATGLQEVLFDTGAPTVTLVDPADAVTVTTTPTFNYTYSDALTGGTCYLYIDGVRNGLTTNVTGTNSTVPTGSVLNAPHTWFINCIDYAGNSANSSTTRQFSLTSGGTTAVTPTATPVPATPASTSGTTTGGVSGIPISSGGGEVPAPVEQTQSLGSSSSVSGTFSETSTEFTVSYTAPAGGFSGEVTYTLPLDYQDYVNGLVTITPEPKSVAPGSIKATWDVALAPQETFEAQVEVAKKLDSAILNEFKAPSVAAKQSPAVSRPTVTPAASQAPVQPTPAAAADNTLWYAVGAIVLLGILYYVFVGNKPKHKGL